MPELGGGPAERCTKIRPADITDEERVTRQHRMRVRALSREVVHENRNRFRRVPRCLEDAQPDAAELKRIAVGHRHERVLGPGARAKVDAGTGALPEFQMPGYEVGV